MIKLIDLFEIGYGVNLAFNKMDTSIKEIPFVSRTAKNNGVSGYVKRLENIKPNPANTISVSCGGSVMESFLQTEEYYSGRDLYYLKPKRALTQIQMLYYCMCLRANKYRYNYGRQANKTLNSILVPHPDSLPDFLPQKLPNQPSIEPYTKNRIYNLCDRKWKAFRYDEIFNILGGYYNKKPTSNDKGSIPFIGATEYENGVTSWHKLKKIELTSKDGKERNHPIEKKILKGDTYITISNNGSVGYAFYQPKDFSCSSDINPISIRKGRMNPYTALFLITLIGLERYRFNYGRKWHKNRMKRTKIKLPIDKNGNLDWQFMEDYIKSLPYSSNL